MIKKIVFIFSLVCAWSIFAKPKVVVFIVVDQFAEHYIPKLENFLHHGIHRLLTSGVVYTNAFYPHAVLETAVGHTSLGTGTVPGVHVPPHSLAKHVKGHGIVANDWLASDGSDRALTAHTLQEITAAPLARIFLQANSHNKAIAISLKDRAAGGLVGTSAPIIWFDVKKENFVASMSDPIIDALLQQARATLAKPYKTSWKLAYNDEQYYKFSFIDNYDHASEPSLLAPQAHEGTDTSRKKFLQVFLKLPAANQLLLDLAREYIVRSYSTSETDGTLLVYISLSSLDKIGHIYGPFSREVIDMIYHLDKQLGDFQNALARIVVPEDTLYILTADHGVMPIPELIKDQYPQAQRIVIGNIVGEVNTYIKRRFGIDCIIRGHKIPHVYLNQQVLRTLPHHRRDAVINAVRTKLSEYPGISYVYHAATLLRTPVPAGSMAWRFKNNIYPGRSGDLLLQIAPYAIVSKYTGGTKHYTPYDYNTHVPLIIYQPKMFEKKVITEKVWVNQVTASLADMLNVQKAPHMLAPLPGLTA
jgi:hypothetical protein